MAYELSTQYMDNNKTAVKTVAVIYVNVVSTI